MYPSAYANIWASKYCKGKVGRTKKAGGGICKVALKVKETLMERIHEWIKKMVGREMGGYWSSKEKWKISTLWKTKGKQELIQNASHLQKPHECQAQKASAVKRKRAVSNTGPKPTNVATFSKRDRKAIGGII